MNAKKCKALRRIVGWRDQKVQYNIPPLVPVYNLTPTAQGKARPTLSHFKTATVTLVAESARGFYKRLKRFAKETPTFNYAT